MRERLIDTIRKEELNIIDYINDLNELVFNSSCSVYFEKAFVKSIYSDQCINISDFIRRKFPVIIDSNEFVMNYIEFILNIYEVIDGGYVSRYQIFDQLSSFIRRGLTKIGCSTREDDDGYISVYYENIEIETITIQLDETKQSKIYKYLSIRKGDIDDKLVIIKDLMNDVEPITNKNKDNKEINKIKQLYQCIRHTEEDVIKQRKFPFMYNDDTKEEWLDKIFLSIVNLFGYNEIKEFAKEIKDNEQD